MTKDFFGSKKAFAMLIGIAGVIVAGYLQLSEIAQGTVATIVMAYLGAQAYVDKSKVEYGTDLSITSTQAIDSLKDQLDIATPEQLQLIATIIKNPTQQVPKNS